jgi:hypothetical protein
VKVAAAVLVLLLAGCSSSPVAPSSPAASTSEPARSWLAMEPGDARAFDGPGGELLLIFVDETYDIDGTYASALTWELDEDYTTDYFVQADDGTLWWYGRKGSWHAGRHGERPRKVDLVDRRARFGDRVITLSEAGAPERLRTRDGVYTS